MRPFLLPPGPLGPAAQLPDSLPFPLLSSPGAFLTPGPAGETRVAGSPFAPWCRRVPLMRSHAAWLPHLAAGYGAARAMGTPLLQEAQTGGKLATRDGLLVMLLLTCGATMHAPSASSSMPFPALQPAVASRHASFCRAPSTALPDGNVRAPHSHRHSLRRPDRAQGLIMCVDVHLLHLDVARSTAMIAVSM